MSAVTETKRRMLCAMAASPLFGLAGLTPRPAFAQKVSLPESIAKRGELRIGWGVWVPYMFLDPKTRQTTGITVSIGKAIAEHFGVKVSFIETTWATMVAGLQADKYDMTMPYLITEERAKVVLFTNPILKSNWGLMVPQKEVQKYKSWEDLNRPGMRITTTMGSSAPRFLKKLDRAQHLLMKDGSDSIAQLLSGQADAWLSQYDAFRVAGKQHASLAVVPGPSLGFEDVAFAVRKDDAALKESLDRFFGEIKTNGRLLEMVKEYGLDQTSISA